MQIPVPDYTMKPVIWKINRDGSKKGSIPYSESDDIFTRHGFYK